MKEPQTQCGVIAIIGEPNAGKSTLLNTLMGEKVSIVSHKAQTTLKCIRGILNLENIQMIFIDTPGLCDKAKANDPFALKSVWHGVEESDVIFFILDVSKGFLPYFENILRKLAVYQKPVALILNKVDLLPDKKTLLLKAAQINQKYSFDATFMICATRKQGTKELLSWVMQKMPHQKWRFPANQTTDLALSDVLSELTREKIYVNLHQELPYHLKVMTQKIEKKSDAYRIEQTVFVKRISQRKIVLGAGGQMIKKVGMAARQEMEKKLRTTVHLFLDVKLEKGAKD